MSVVISSDLKHHISRHTSGDSKQLPNPRKTLKLISFTRPLLLSGYPIAGMGEEETLQPAQQPEHCGVL